MVDQNPYIEIKAIVTNIKKPDLLNDHPWTKSIVVKNEVEKDSSLALKSPGHQLIFTVAKLFRKTMPSTMPKRGKRLDTNWGQFGMLAAQYFAPFFYNTVFPNSLRDASGRIDQAISYFVFDKPDYDLSKEDIDAYRIIGDEVELIPISTLSDWQIKGLQNLADHFISYEQFLNNISLTDSNSEKEFIINNADIPPKNNPFIKKIIWINPILNWFKRKRKIVLLGLLFVALLLIGLKTYRIIHAANVFLDDIRAIESLAEIPEEEILPIELVDQASEIILKSKIDFSALKNEINPFLKVTPYLSWIPKYGGDIGQSQEILTYTDGLLNTLDESIMGISPTIDVLFGEENEKKLDLITSLLIEAQPHLLIARSEFGKATNAYNEIDIQKLTPKISDKIIKIQPLLQLLDTALTTSVAIPKLLGATDEGPKTYIIILQNEDELRATGGFITGVVTIVIDNGKILSYKVEDSYAVDNPNQYYPPAPWQLEQYMDAYYWVFRDANWSPDFPTVAKWAEMFIATSRNYTVDGVIAIDQEALCYILAAIGPVEVSNSTSLITSENLIDYMRSSKSDMVLGGQSDDRKSFMGDLAEAIIKKLQSGGEVSWDAILSNIEQTLDEKHIQIQVDDPTISSLLAQQNWDGAILMNQPDYLFAVNSNIGFNKVNAVIEDSITYEIDLSNQNAPSSLLKIIIKNNAIGQPNCDINKAIDLSMGFYLGQINRCYLDYLRVYVPIEANIVESTLHTVPAAMTALDVEIPAKVDTLIDEVYPGIQGYGTLLYVPGGQSLETKFLFQLPPSVIEASGNLSTYALHVEKQAGTKAIPIKIVIHLPAGSELTNASMDGIIEGNTWTINTDLRQDVELSVTFSNN